VVEQFFVKPPMLSYAVVWTKLEINKELKKKQKAFVHMQVEKRFIICHLYHFVFVVTVAF